VPRRNGASYRSEETALSVPEKRARTLREPDNLLVAHIRTSSFSYFIVSHRPTPDTERIDDEAIIEIDAEILKIEPPQPQHLGQQISWSIVCARSFHRGENARRAGEVPLLYSVTLRKNARSLLAYLPADAFWAMLARLETGKLNYIEACYQKPSRGFAELTSLHFFR
jgi:hypothetical protein